MLHNMKNPATETPGSGPRIASVSDRTPRRRSKSRVAQLRIERGVVQDELATLLGTSVPRYSGIENATLEEQWRWPTVEQAQRLSEFFGAGIPDLWPFLTIGPCGCGRALCSELTFNGRWCRSRRMGPAELGCDACKKPLDYRRPARVGERNFHRECYLQLPRPRTGETRLCPVCEKPVYRKPSRAKRYSETACSPSHWAQHRLRLGWRAVIIKQVAASNLKRFGSTRLFGHVGGRPRLSKKHEAIVRKAAGVALDCYRRNPDTPRGNVIALVVYEIEGRDKLFTPEGTRRLSRDAVRRAAEKRAIRRLDVAATLPDFGETLLARDFG
jgi:transcriptional regulator with XRE-family HTH domain